MGGARFLSQGHPDGGMRELRGTKPLGPPRSTQPKAGRGPAGRSPHRGLCASRTRVQGQVLPGADLPGSRTSFWEVMQSTCTFIGGAGPIWPRACGRKLWSALTLGHPGSCSGGRVSHKPSASPRFCSHRTCLLVWLLHAEVSWLHGTLTPPSSPINTGCLPPAPRSQSPPQIIWCI